MTKAIVAIFSALLITVVAAPARCDNDWLTSQQWTVDQKSSADGSVTPTADGLTVSLTPDAAKTPVLINCAAPIAIPAGSHRLSVWADPATVGYVATWRNTNAGIVARVADASGAVYQFPFSWGSLANRGWGQLSTEDLSLRPNVPPWKGHLDGPLTLVGLQVQSGWTPIKTLHLHELVADSDPHALPERPWQVISLPDPANRDMASAWSSTSVSYVSASWQGMPSIPADAIVDKPGAYKIGVRIRSGYEGPIAGECSENLTLNADTLEIDKRNTIPLQTAKPGTYFVEVRSWDGDGLLNSIKYFLLIDPGHGVVATSPLAVSPGGFLNLSTTNPSHVFDADQPIKFTVSAQIPSVSGAKQLHVLLTDYEFDKLSEQTIPIPDSGAGPFTTTIAFPKDAAEACRAFVDLDADGKVVDQDSLMLGKSSAPSGRESAPPVVANDSFSGVTTSSLLVNAVAPDGLDTLSRVSRGMDQAKLSGNAYVEIEMPWRDIEPLPGLYQFDLIDKICDLAVAKGIKVVFAAWFLSGHAPSWILPHEVCYEDGSSSLVAGSQSSTCASDPVVQNGVQQLWGAIARRYHANPGIAGYLSTGASLDLGYWHLGLQHRTDYSQSAVDDFHHYLRDVKRYSLADLGKRYGASYAVWDDVQPPVPDWSSLYDLRPIWVDFCAYQQWELYNWMDRNLGAIRAQDPTHALYQYNFVGYGPQEYYYPLLKKYNAGVTTGGSEGPDYAEFESTYHLWGLKSRGGETIQDVRTWNLYASFFNMLAYGGEGDYYEVQWHNAYPEPWSTEPNGSDWLQKWSSTPDGGWIKRVSDWNFSPDYAKWSPIFKELGDSKPMPIEAGSFYSWENNLYQARWLNPYMISGWDLLMDWEAKEHRLPQFISDGTPLDMYSKLKLMVVDSDVAIMSKDTAQKLTDYVKGGGCLITFAPTAQYTVDTGQPDGNFLAGLGLSGFTPTTDTSDQTTVTTDSPLKGETLAFKSFYTGTLPPAPDILASLPDGRPAVIRRHIGQGEVILFLGQLDWLHSTHILDALCRYKNVTRWCDSTDPRIHVATIQKGTTRFLIAHYRVYSYGRPLLDFVGKDTVQTTVSIEGLAPGNYAVRELNDGVDMGTFTAAQLAAGVPLSLQTGETKVLECTRE